MKTEKETSEIKFSLDESKSTPIILLKENGDVVIKGKKSVNDIELVNAMKEFISHTLPYNNDMDFIKLIAELNEFNDSDEYFFSYHTNGFVDIINFNETMIWNSEWDEREYIEEKDEYEPLLPYIKKSFNRYLDEISLLKFKDI